MTEKPKNSEGLAARLWGRYQKFAQFLAMAGVLTASVEVIVLGVRFWDDWNDLKALVEGDKVKDQKIEALEKYVRGKKQTYSVGFRVKKTKDEETGKVKKVKQWRDWKGRLNDIYLDHELTDLYGFDTYYYIDKETHEKIYCF